MTTKTIYFSHGDKGGVGKSVVASVVTDWLLSRNTTLALVDGDNNKDVASRFAGDARMESVYLNLNDPSEADAVMGRFGIWLENNTADSVVLNLPANASQTLDQQAEILRDMADALDYRLAATFSLGKGQACSDALQESLASGLLSVIDPGNRMVLYPAFDMKPEESSWYDVHRKQYAGHEAVFPALKPRDAFTEVLNHAKPYSALLQAQPHVLHLHTRSVLARWVASARRALAPLFPALEV